MNQYLQTLRSAARSAFQGPSRASPRTSFVTGFTVLIERLATPWAAATRGKRAPARSTA